MFELVKVGERTYYIKNYTNIGVYVEEDNKVWLIDAGNDKEAGKKILKVIEENNMVVNGIINTHSNADHIGGNKVIEDRCNIEVLCHGIENCFINYPILEPSFLYGGYPYKELRNKFLMAKSGSNVKEVLDNLPKGIEIIDIKGHFFDMIGVKTSDNVYFLGDSLFSEDTINKYNIFYIYNVEEYLSTLDRLEELKGKMFIPSHTEACEDISSLIELNRNKIYEVCKLLLEICKEEKIYEEIVKIVFDRYNLEMNVNQYVLIGSTIKSYLSYLKDNDEVEIIIKDNYLYWKSK